MKEGSEMRARQYGMRARQYGLSTCVVQTLSLLLVSFQLASPLRAEQFDWRAYPGKTGLPAGNYVTAVRNQGSAGTCWAFAATAALEANYDITFKINNSLLNLSEQHLVCDGTAGDIDGGWEDAALDFIRDHGIVDEVKLPYTASNTSPNWPLTPPYTLYRITSDQHWFSISTTPDSLKNYLKTYGPVTAAIDANTDFFTPTNPPHYAGDTFASLGGNDIPPDVVLNEVARDNPNNLNHAVLITGFSDDLNAAGGGYWHIKNSWGGTWGPTGNGYGYVSFTTMHADNYVTGINGAAFTQSVPEPSTLALLGLGASCLLGCAWRRRDGLLP
jgi:C1A family cysteine protease